MADVPGKFFSATKVRTGVAPSSSGSIVGEPLPPVNPPGSSLNSVGLTMPSAFTVSNSPLTANGTIGVAGAGTVGQYIRGDGSLADFPESSGGGSSVSYYLNGSISQGTIGGVAYKEMNKVPILGAGTDFTINADGYIASFITDAGDPNLLEIPGGNWNFETYFSASSSGGTPTFYVELYKYDGTTFTLIASSSSSPELIAFGTNLNPYFSTLAVPTTTLALTDRLAIRYYVTHSGRTITLHTENNHLCQVVTTFTTGLTSLNGLTAQVQNFAVGTSGTDFNIASATATHTFNLPTASATNRGALSSADWSLFNQAYNDKINSAAVTGTTTKTLTLTQQDGGTITASWSDLNTDAVTSVFGRTGAVVAANGDYTTAQVTESGNLYYTEARVSANTDVAANTAARHNAVTLGTANGLSLSTQQLSLALASGSTTGSLSSTDWTTFNNKQNALTNPVTGSGTTNYLPKFTGSTTIGNSIVQEGNAGIFINGVDNFIPTNGGWFFNGSGNYASGIFASSSSNNLNLRSPQKILFQIGFSTEAMTLSSSGNLLVGTNSDNGAKLQVSTGNLFLASLIGSGGESILRLQNTAINGRNWYIIAGGNIGAFSNGEFGIYDATSSTARLTITSTGAATFSSSVTAQGAINVGSAGSLQINAGSAATPLLTQSTNYTELYRRSGGVGIYLGGTGDPANYYDNTTHFFRSSGGGSTYVTINSSGNLGLGITPSAWGSSWKALELSNGVYLTAFSSSAVPIMILGANAHFDNTNFIYKTTAAATRYQQDSGVHYWYNAPSGTAGNAITFTQAMTLNASGNLGLGVTPSAWGSSGVVAKALQVNNISLASTDSNGMQLSSNAYWDGSSWRYIASSVSATNYFQGGGSHGWRTAPSGTAGNAISFTQAMTLFSTGNLLVGSPSPISDNGARLQVSGTSTFSDNINTNRGNDRANILFNTTAGVFRWGMGLINTETGSNVGGDFTLFRYNDNGSFNNFALTVNRANGNVLIGTTTDNGARLQVSGAARFDGGGSNGYLYVSGNAGAGGSTNPAYLQGMNFSWNKSNASGESLLTYTNQGGGSNIRFGIGYWNNSTYSEQVSVLANGNVGIGTPSPQSKLSIGGNGYSGRAITAISNNADYAVTFQQDSTSGAGLQIFTTATNWGSIPLNISDGTFTQLRLTSGGNLLVGTTTDNGARLQVSGDIRTTGTLRVEGNTDPNSGAAAFFWNQAFLGPTISGYNFEVRTGNTGSQARRLFINESGAATFSSSVTAGGTIVASLDQGSNNQFFNLTGTQSGFAQTYSLGIVGSSRDFRIFDITANQQRLTITSGGNVLIGTQTSGGAKLEVVGDTYLRTQLFTDTIRPYTGNQLQLLNGGSNFLYINGNVLIGTQSDNGSKLRVNGSLALPHVTKSANYTLDGTDYTVGFDCASNRTATLPDATTCSGRIYVIYQYNTGSGARSVTLDGNGSQTINGATTYSLFPYCDCTSVMIQSNGSNWIIIASNLTADCL